jgi:hypothetical protein
MRFGLTLALLFFACQPSSEIIDDAALPDGPQSPDAGTAAADAAPTFTRYPGEGVRSPITPSVTARMREIAARNPGRDSHVFMKIGASGTVSQRLLYCFDPSQGRRLDLDGRDDLAATLAWFLEGDADGTTPFARATKAAESGEDAVWAISGDPSPVERELGEINPRFAFVNYGTNDMGGAGSLSLALVRFHAAMSELLDGLEREGIVPLVSGLNPRGDLTSYARWVPTFDAVTRAMAEERQLPYLSMYAASSPLPNLGLISDGIHGNVYTANGAIEPCVFDALGLGWNYNVRNLESLRLLDEARRAVYEGNTGAPGGRPPMIGTGTHADPFIIDGLPFFHAADTRLGESRFHSYPACDQGQDEGGPEIVYRLDPDSPLPLRAVVLDGPDVDIDVHLLSGQAAADCVARHDRVVEAPLAAGEVRIVLDSFVSGGTPQSGRYLLVLLPCEAGDPACE